MDNKLVQNVIKLNKRRKAREWWTRIAKTLAVVVVFCTSYALILPAITLQDDAVCGMQEHIHSEECYAVVKKQVFVCNLPEDVQIVHLHNERCFGEDGYLICNLTETAAHTHSENCYEEVEVLTCPASHVHGEECILIEKDLICEQEEIVCHTHTDSCYQEEQIPCQEISADEHVHGEQCYAIQQQQVCTVENIPVHTHDESCFTEFKELICELPEYEEKVHIHTDECYTIQQQLLCTVEEGPDHTHAEDCFIQTTELVCTVPEYEKIEHVHGEQCYIVQQQQVCTAEEAAAHIHDKNCFIETKELICTVSHVHDEECGGTKKTLICTIPEYEGKEHIHTDECYEIKETVTCEIVVEKHEHTPECYTLQQELCCGLQDIQLHSHSGDCYNQDGLLICTLTECIEHIHTEECIEEIEVIDQDEIICETEEHIHTDECYHLNEEDGNGTITFICGFSDHIHTEECNDEQGQLVCTVPEHIHRAECVVENLDLTADVETAEQWDTMVSRLQFTGNWPTDIVNLAASQLGYTESSLNVILDGEKIKGYTRYGAKYDAPYGDWNIMFLHFVLEYAGVENYPVDIEIPQWIDLLKNAELFATVDSYTPAPGDIVFFDTDNSGIPSRVGILTEIHPATEDSHAKITVIEGDSDNKVASLVYDLDDSRIAGYGRIPTGHLTIIKHSEKDYEVTVSFDESAQIPPDATLLVREILPDTEEYSTYYHQSVAALEGNITADVDRLVVSFARFFDISFESDGQIIEPSSAVDIHITYKDRLDFNNGNQGVVVHFAEDGVEVISPEISNEGTETADGFAFTQNSFSVTGTLITYAVADPNTYVTVSPNSLDSSGNTSYVVYTKLGDNYYAVDGNGNPVQITVDENGAITSTVNNNLLWRFTFKGAPNTHLIRNVGTGRYMHSYDNNTGEGVTTGGAYNSSLVYAGNGSDISFYVKSNNDYSCLATASRFSVVQDINSASSYYLAARAPSSYHVWIDGTNGGIMSLYGSDNTYYSVSRDSNTFTLPTEWKTPYKYAYKINGWYDIVSNTYYPPGATVEITQNAVFFADWVAATYDVGVDNGNVVETLDTNSFIKTYVFDFNSLFNVQSVNHLGNISASRHDERWTSVTNGPVAYNNENTLDFLFLDYDASGVSISMPADKNNHNVNQSTVTQGIHDIVYQASGGKNLFDILFNPDVEIIGKKYVGEGNYMYNYMDATTPNYDGHDGYYYFHSRRNAASYNQSEQRFYLYDYLERTSDSEKDGGPGEYSDFLPFNSIYANTNGRNIKTYTDPDTGLSGYQFDAKQNGQGSAYDNAGTNYWFATRSDIEFYLPNDSGDMDDYGNYGNISTKGKHMIFEFHGDDDVWVFVDGELLLDLGGVHGVEYGQIDFSTGTVTVNEGSEAIVKTFEEILGPGRNVKAGDHVMSFCYMERGSSQSNSSIYFNIAPRYDLEIKKEDIFTAQVLDDAQFSIYDDEALTKPTELWPSYQAYVDDIADGTIDNSINTINVKNGYAKAWGVSAGRTYYIVEDVPPVGYPQTDDIIRVTLNNRGTGTASVETSMLRGSDNRKTEGFGVLEQEVNDTLQAVRLLVTNQTDMETTQIRVQKTWDPSSTFIPASIDVFLTLDGQRVGRTATLNESNGWAYTWNGLPKYAADGITPLEYQVEEVLVSGYNTTDQGSEVVSNYVDWFRVADMENSATYLLVHSGNALAYDGNRFNWIDLDVAKGNAYGSAHWVVTTDHAGFHLKNESGYTITFDRANKKFYAVNDDSVSLNQVFYYVNSRLMLQDNDVYYYFGDGGAANTDEGLLFILYKREEITGTLFRIHNEPIDSDKLTYLQVNKQWADNKDHSKDSVTIKLYADGKDTGRTVILNQANNWQGTFEDIPYYNSAGTAPVKYTVVEQKIDHYDAVYSDYTTLQGKPVLVWRSEGSFTANGIYRFAAGSYALSTNALDEVISRANNITDTYQQWKAVNYNWGYILQNVATGKYLAISGNKLYMTSAQSSAVKVSINNNLLTFGNYYLELAQNRVAVTGIKANGTTLIVSRKYETVGMSGTAVTVTNVVSEYILPESGGYGQSVFTYSGMFVLALTAVVYIFGKIKRKEAYRE